MMNLRSRHCPRAGLLSVALIGALAAAFASAEATAAPELPKTEAKPPEADYTLTGNFGICSQYIFRGLTQTDTKPAAQGGFDYANKNGLYLGTWLSNISWLSDSGACNHGCTIAGKNVGKATGTAVIQRTF
jgi:uncharacterized protein (TIGR02001 family)